MVVGDRTKVTEVSRAVEAGQKSGKKSLNAGQKTEKPSKYLGRWGQDRRAARSISGQSRRQKSHKSIWGDGGRTEEQGRL